MVFSECRWPFPQAWCLDGAAVVVSLSTTNTHRRFGRFGPARASRCDVYHTAPGRAASRATVALSPSVTTRLCLGQASQVSGQVSGKVSGRAGLLGGRDAAQRERHQCRGQGEQYRGQGERRGGGAQQLPAPAAQWLGGAQQPVYPLHRVVGTRGQG